MSADHWEDYTESMLSRKLHTLFELVLKDCRVKAASENIQKYNKSFLFTPFIFSRNICQVYTAKTSHRSSPVLILKYL